ncbi:MAG: hypothetical protein A2W91_11715 [Bacteroidetes bacterium GWF2_38_335]|nr:MAG: hypothetical protein A2W91_11715 [Bacteroidetes bacterium GWF2_38_335]OFY77946.1 MAG: hypothetical protein A2281_18460 [Bacteroidetes bacterium RIFOXYA12_FULL_38_20]HBS86687.1 hypothetical protein [Bacteroidales bacterium]
MEIKTIGLVILIASVLMGIVMLFSRGSVRLQKPGGGIVPLIYNIVNLFVLSILTPVIAIVYFKEITVITDIISLKTGDAAVFGYLQVAGMVLYIAGSLLVYAGRIYLWENFRLGAVKPDENNKLVTGGPFRIARHPMYLAVLLMSLGLSLVLFSWIYFIFFLILIFTILKMIPVEESQLKEVYGRQYEDYCKKVRSIGL